MYLVDRAPFTRHRLPFAPGIVLLVALAGCAHEVTAKAPVPRPVGGDRDAHGCLTSAGYTWCAREKSCVRSWELAEKKGFANTFEDYREYCAGELR